MTNSDKSAEPTTHNKKRARAQEEKISYPYSFIADNFAVQD